MAPGEALEAVPLTGERALHIPSLRLLAVGDLHLGFELGWEETGVRVPHHDGKMAARLDSLLQRTGASRLVLNGDVVDPLFGKARLRRRISGFFDTIPIKQIDIVKGNHDSGIEGLVPEWVRVHPSSGVRAGDAAFCHGHAMPGAELLGARTLVLSHSHPAVAFETSIAGRRRTEVCWLRWRKEARRRRRTPGLAREVARPNLIEEVVVMPPFNPLMAGGGVNLKERRVAPVFSRLGIPVEDAEVWLLDGTHLGRVRDLPVLERRTPRGTLTGRRAGHPSARYTPRRRRWPGRGLR